MKSEARKAVSKSITEKAEEALAEAIKRTGD